MVAMIRAFLADPDQIKKARAGRLDEIRRCVEEMKSAPDRSDYEAVKALALRTYAHLMDSVAIN